MSEEKMDMFGETWNVNGQKKRLTVAVDKYNDRSTAAINYTKMFEMIHQKYIEVVENVYQQLLLVSGCGSAEEFKRQGYILKDAVNPAHAFNRTVSLFKICEMCDTKHIVSFEITADFSDGVVKFIAKPLVNELEK